ncbi:uncharacterized protein I303_102923 [Kwoniella dejecticola CBS 10117]|uniref:Cleavage and polyadenylation specificity factor subunit 4 n=1 Tax=Kwoniella dejecticola CBS 10117 TaxID=1296121 RepID=A0A1A6AA42_9TREE|nr:cleavage and polyadenylation specificity factor subunit 4 [Kwoniella dejecticola CBS 10117]OBR86922.1 cleavage and polyadenylation specificity factor subunit 4 [Kwoniella dejecticola CBS 10117]
MSVPLPSPSPLDSPSKPNGHGNGTGSTAKPIPKSRPSPIATHTPHSPSSPNFTGTGSVNRGRSGLSSSVSRSMLNDDNWRDRSPASAATAATPSTATATAATNGKFMNAGSARGPERTIGGFEKREIKSTSTVSGLSANKAQKDTREKKTAGDDAAEGDKAGLSHVPCRFFKAGACTAGDSCPFSHAAPDAAKREVCQWFLKGNCKFGHKCALAHVRPGEPMSMDRKNKKAAQLEARERGDSVGASAAPPAPSSGTGTGNANGLGESPRPLGIMRGRKNSASPGDEHIASPVPIKSALSSSMQSPQTGRLPSSPLREPFGPPSGALPNSPNSAGFAQPRGIQGFASSPSRPSPLSASFGATAGASGSVPGPLSLKASASNPLGSPLRPPVTTAPGFSSSFSHPSLSLDRHGHSTAPAVPLSASFAGDANLHKSIWARSDTPEEPLSPRRRPIPRPTKSNQDAVFIDDEDHGEDFLPSSLSDLLTPQERARRMSRRDSQGQEDYAQSPGGRYGSPLWNQGFASGGERLAQSAGPALGPGGSGFLKSLWSADGEDARKYQQDTEGEAGHQTGGSPSAATTGTGAGAHAHASNAVEGEDGFAFGPTTAKQAPKRQTSLLTQQRSPTSGSSITSPTSPNRQIHMTEPYLIRNLESSSPSATKVLEAHLPGQSLPGGLASALSRLHMQNTLPKHSGLSSSPSVNGTGNGQTQPKIDAHGQGHDMVAGVGKKGHSEDEDDGLFDMDG